MKKCNLYLDFVNSDNFSGEESKDSKDLRDVYSHTEHCVDCSYDKKMREALLFSLKNQAEPEYPENIHELIVNAALDKGESATSEEATVWENFFYNLLRPLEIAAPLACLIMLGFMLQVNSDISELSSREYKLAERSLKKDKIAEANTNYQEEGLPKISSEEVKEFLAKLDEFQRLNPESKGVKSFNRPDIRLVTDR